MRTKEQILKEYEENQLNPDYSWQKVVLEILLDIRDK